MTKVINAAIGVKRYLDDKAKRRKKVRKLQTDFWKIFEGSVGARFGP